MKIAIFGRITDNTSIQSLLIFFEYLQEIGITFYLFEAYKISLEKKYGELLSHYPNMRSFESVAEIQGVKFVYSFGGDGTVLECVRMLGSEYKSLPILGVNFGRLGYLTTVSQQNIIQATQDLLKDCYNIETRNLLTIVSEPAGIFGKHNFGLNDLTLHKSNTNEMITVHVYVNGEFLNSYKGDGLIIATPTGSTAYSLACGGPIIFPSSQNFIITPVAPHSLTVRPVVLPDTCVISCEVESRSGQAMLALDTRTEQVSTGTRLAVRKADFSVKLVRPYESKYIHTLRTTLIWGSDARK